MEELKKARQRMLRYLELNAKLEDMRARRSALEEQETRLRQIRMAEQQDVDKLTGKSLTAFFYTFTGKVEEKLRLEKRQAAEAALRHDMVKSELDSLVADIAEAEAECRPLVSSELEYAWLLEQYSAQMQKDDPVKGPRLLKTEQEIADRRSRIGEINEAVSAGEAALECARGVKNSLDSAHGWGVADMIGGGLIADLAKHSHLDEAQKMLEDLQTQLGRFHNELSDVDISAEFRVDVEGFLRFSDYFFDGLFVDWAVMDRINASQRSVSECVTGLQNALGRLKRMRQESVEQIELLQNERDRIINE